MPTQALEADLETIYAAISRAINEVPERQESVFLCKVIMILALQMADVQSVLTALNTARSDL